MHEISPQDVTAELMALFDARAPASLRCCAVLDGTSRGRIFVDNRDRPRWGAVQEAAFGTVYFGGAPDAPTIHRLIATLRRDGDVLVGFWDGDPLEQLLPPSPDYVGRVLEFLDRDAAPLQALVDRLPEGYAVRPVDRALFERCLWYADTVRAHGSAEAYLAKARAVCLMHGDEIVCEASTGPLIRGVRELGVITHERHRGREFATGTSAYLVAACEQAGERTYWNCAVTNVASAAVARKLGYRTEREYTLHAWFRPVDRA